MYYILLDQQVSPKGVLHTQKSALAFINWAADYFDITNNDIFSSHAPLHFDLSIFDIFVSLKVGAEICLIPKVVTAFPASLAQYIKRNKITVWYSVPSALMNLIDNSLASYLKSLRLVFYAGEVFPYNKFKELKKQLPQAYYYNLYGPSETNVITYYKISESVDEIKDDIPLGYACPYAKIIVIKDNGQKANIGEKGELVVSCDSLMMGYLNRDDLTEKCIMSTNIDSECNEKYYYTGDIVKVIGDGKYTFVSRKDNMIKINGFRVEIGEIENTIYKLESVKEALVKVIKNNITSLTLFLSLKDNCDLNIIDIERHLRCYLPEYMIPHDIVIFQKELPRNSHGKLDFNLISVK